MLKDMLSISRRKRTGVGRGGRKITENIGKLGNLRREERFVGHCRKKALTRRR